MPKVDHPRRAKTKHRSLQEKGMAYDQMQHSTWDKGETPRTRATVSAPKKRASIGSRIFSAAKKAAGSAVRRSTKGARGLLKQDKKYTDPNAAQRRDADKKQREMVGLRDLTTGLRRVDLIAGIAKSIAKKT